MGSCSSTTSASEDGYSVTFPAFSFNSGHYRNAYLGRFNPPHGPAKAIVKIAKRQKLAELVKKKNKTSRSSSNLGSSPGKPVSSKVVASGNLPPTPSSNHSSLNALASSIAKRILSLPPSASIASALSDLPAMDVATNMMFEDVLVSTLASLVSKEFNKRPDGSSPTVKRPLHFAVPRLVTVPRPNFLLPAPPFCPATIEPYIEGEYHRFVSNNGTLLYNGTVGAFCHYSYHASAGNLLVMDIQGVRTETMYDLTDPACHSAGEGGLFGELDLGDRGIRAFFLTHECNGLCRGLLKPQSSEGDKIEMKERIMMRGGNFDPTKREGRSRKERRSRG